MTVVPIVTWPSPPSATMPSFLTQRIVVWVKTRSAHARESSARHALSSSAFGWLLR